MEKVRGTFRLWSAEYLENYDSEKNAQLFANELEIYNYLVIMLTNKTVFTAVCDHFID